MEESNKEKRDRERSKALGILLNLFTNNKKRKIDLEWLKKELTENVIDKFRISIPSFFYTLNRLKEKEFIIEHKEEIHTYYIYNPKMNEIDEEFIEECFQDFVRYRKDLLENDPELQRLFKIKLRLKFKRGYLIYFELLGKDILERRVLSAKSNALSEALYHRNMLKSSKEL
ncbi:MAG: hypothetical protein HWN65_21270 [Candidatus Helarchaeota archaeon]|nr:hypothetical protein [Candidatus Helarchaeota archaeon]